VQRKGLFLQEPRGPGEGFPAGGVGGLLLTRLLPTLGSRESERPGHSGSARCHPPPPSQKAPRPPIWAGRWAHTVTHSFSGHSLQKALRPEAPTCWADVLLPMSQCLLWTWATAELADSTLVHACGGRWDPEGYQERSGQWGWGGRGGGSPGQCQVLPKPLAETPGGHIAGGWGSRERGQEVGKVDQGPGWPWEP
jgi:hypothetical protein